MIKIGIIGVGYFGEKHLENILSLKKIFNIVGIYDKNQQKSQEISRKYNTNSFNSIDALVQHCDAINITSSTNSHYEIIKFCVKKNKHIFIEKPISEKIEEITEIRKITQGYKKIIQIGFIERFNDAFLSLLLLNFSIKKIKALRTGLINDRNKNSCIIQDMMIHDIDIINYIIASYISNISIKKESTKNKVICKLTFENNCIAEIKAERSKLISREKSERKIMIYTQNNEQIILDLLNRKIYLNQKELNKKIENSNPLKSELIHFHNCIKNGKKNEISIQSGYESGLIASEINKKLNELL